MKLNVEVPRAFQPFLKPARYKAVYGGRGGAKSHFKAGQLVLKCYRQPTRAVCIREVQNSIKDSVKQLVEDKINQFNLGSFFKVTEREIEGANGSRILFKGMKSYNAQSIKSLEDIDLAWVEEAQTLSSISLRLLRPTIRAENSEIWFSWNPRYKNDAVDKFFRGKGCPEDSIVIQVGHEDNPWFPDVLKQEMERDYSVDEDMACHVWGGDYEYISEGAYYSKLILELEKEGRITSVPYDPDYPVYTAWDLGLDNSTAIWFVQVVGPEVRVIDYYEARNTALIEIAREVMRKPYVYQEHYMPHDIEVRVLVTAKTRLEHLESIGFRPIRPGSQLPVGDGINAVQTLLRKCVFDQDKCETGLAALRVYRTKYDEEKEIFNNKPYHDWSSDAADAFRELAVNLYDVRASRARNKQRVAQTEYDPFAHNTRIPSVTHDYDPLS